MVCADIVYTVDPALSICARRVSRRAYLYDPFGGESDCIYAEYAME